MNLHFPLFTENMSLEEEVEVVNLQRLGMFKNDMQITEVNKYLDEMLPHCTEAEICNLIQNLSMGYSKVKQWNEKQRKTAIRLDVSEKELAEQLKVEELREGKKASAKQKRLERDLRKLHENSENSSEEKTKFSGPVGKIITYDSDAAINKAIKEFIKTTGSYSSAVAMLKAIGGLPSDYKEKDF